MEIKFSNAWTPDYNWEHLVCNTCGYVLPVSPITARNMTMEQLDSIKCPKCENKKSVGKVEANITPEKREENQNGNEVIKKTGNRKSKVLSGDTRKPKL